jgi:hypothetical protein
MNADAINDMFQWAFDRYVTAVKEMDADPKKAERCKYCPFQLELDLPIDSIDGVKLESAKFCIYRGAMQIRLKINNKEYTQSIAWFSDTKCESLVEIEGGFRAVSEMDAYLSKNAIKEGCEKLFEFIENVKFHNFDGYFTTDPIKTLPVKGMCKLASLGKSKAKKTVTDCCVCYEPTQTHFECNHTVCGKCISNMECGYGKLKCPMCRAKITLDECREEEAESSDDE